MKVICAGYPKSGTKSLANALRILGYKVYDVEEAIEFGFEEWTKILKNESTDVDAVIDKVYTEDVEAVVDNPHLIFFENFFKRWPGAKVIISVRDEDEQFESYKQMLNDYEKNYWFLRTMSRMLTPTGRSMDGWDEKMRMAISGSVKPNKLTFIGHMRRHFAFVKSLVPQKQILTFDVSQGWEPLCNFLDRPVPDEDFPCRNRQGSSDQIIDKVLTESRVVKKMKVELLVSFTVLQFILCLTAWLFYRWYTSESM